MCLKMFMLLGLEFVGFFGFKLVGGEGRNVGMRVVVVGVVGRSLVEFFIGFGGFY